MNQPPFLNPGVILAAYEDNVLCWSQILSASTSPYRYRERESVRQAAADIGAALARFWLTSGHALGDEEANALVDNFAEGVREEARRYLFDQGAAPAGRGSVVR